MIDGYPRAADLPGAGFAAGPCLFKDTMQLASVTGGSFPLGHSAMLVNEGLPDYLVRAHGAASTTCLSMTVGILGMAFKAESDDRRSSLSYRLKRVLAFRAARVLTTDPYVDRRPRPACRSDEVLAEADLLVIGAPHASYRDLRVRRPGRRRVEPPRAGGAWRDPRRRQRRHPRLPRGRGHRAGSSTGSSTGSRSTSRCSSSSTTRRTRRWPPSREHVGRRHPGADPGQHLRPRAGQRDPLRHRRAPSTRSSS